MPEKILVVDDDVDSLKLISLMLKRQGYEVIVANAGTPALQKAYADRPDLIILDVMMPDMDGYEVTRRLRAEPTTANIPVIMFTAKTLVDDKVQGFEAGADDYLTKPTHPAELASRVKAVLARRQQQHGGGKAASHDGGLSIGFLGVKGGVGTSSLAAGIAALLAQDGETILGDIRPGQGTLGLMLGHTRTGGLAPVFQNAAVGLSPEQLNRNLLPHDTGMRLLLSSTDPKEVQLNLAPDSASVLLKAMKNIAQYTVLDLGSGLNRVTVRLIRELSQTVLLVDPTSISLYSAQAIIKEFKGIGLQPNQVALVIYNRTQTQRQIPWQDVEQQLGLEVSAIISPAPELAFEAADVGLPLSAFQPDSVVAGQMNKLVEELIKRGRS